MALRIRQGWFVAKRIHLIIFTAIYLIASIAYSLYNYHKEKLSLISEMDQKIKDSVIGAVALIGDDYQDNYNPKSQSLLEQECTLKLNQYCIKTGLTSIYTLILTNNHVIISCMGSSESVAMLADHRRLIGNFRENKINQKGYHASLPLFESFTNQQGPFRSVIYPMKTGRGMIYLAGADISLHQLDTILKKDQFYTIITILFFFLIISPILIFVIFSMKRDYNEYLTNLYKDSLTLLPNRPKLLLDIKDAKNPVLYLINIDSFKEINDFYGNEVGDFILVSMANRIKSLLDSSKYRLYKMQADEYALLFDKIILESELNHLAEILWAGISEKPFLYGGNQILISITLGITWCDQLKPVNWSEIPIRADMALKKAKSTQNHSLIYDESMEISREYENNIHWTKILREAIKENRIIPYFQPIVNNSSQAIEKYECLVRLIDDEGRVIVPSYFLDVSKRSRFYHHITRIIFQKSIVVFEKSELEFTINLSVLDIIDEETNQFILGKLQEFPLVAGRIVFEILESEGVENYIKVKKFIDEVKSFGCKIAIDDFGTGYSNFAHIMKLNVDYIKIAASLIQNIDKDYLSQLITKNITNVAKGLGLKTISEFVPSKEVYEKIVELGVDYSQGYYFGKPQPDILKS